MCGQRTGAGKERERERETETEKKKKEKKGKSGENSDCMGGRVINRIVGKSKMFCFSSGEILVSRQRPGKGGEWYKEMPKMSSGVGRYFLRTGE